MKRRQALKGIGLGAIVAAILPSLVLPIIKPKVIDEWLVIKVDGKDSFFIRHEDYIRQAKWYKEMQEKWWKDIFYNKKEYEAKKSNH